VKDTQGNWSLGTGRDKEDRINAADVRDRYEKLQQNDLPPSRPKQMLMKGWGRGRGRCNAIHRYGVHAPYFQSAQSEGSWDLTTTIRLKHTAERDV